MTEMGIPGATRVAGPTAMDVARERENILVGNEIVRHRLSSRLIHWTVAIFFFGALLSGMPIWSPVFGWMATFFGGLSVCRWLHAWLGVAFSVSMLVMFVHWMGEMKLDKRDRQFRMLDYLKFNAGAEDPEVGKYNGGQKLFFWLAFFAMLLVLITGIPLWWPQSFSWRLRQVAILLHDVGYIFWFVAIVGHIYLGTAAEPGTFRSMTRGTVTRAWARLHHPRWYREVTGDRS